MAVFQTLSVVTEPGTVPMAGMKLIVQTVLRGTFHVQVTAVTPLLRGVITKLLAKMGQMKEAVVDVSLVASIAIWSAVCMKHGYVMVKLIVEMEVMRRTAATPFPVK